MPDRIENYWGTDFPIGSDPAPVVLLKQQAQQLTESTQGKVEGVVKESAEGGTAYTSLYARVPAMGNYQFKILYIAHPMLADPSNPFPITAEDSFGLEKRTLADMQEFDRYLRDLLSSALVRTAIGNLIKYASSRAAS
jgi:hypothetical protein